MTEAPTYLSGWRPIETYKDSDFWVLGGHAENGWIRMVKRFGASGWYQTNSAQGGYASVKTEAPTHWSPYPHPQREMIYEVRICARLRGHHCISGCCYRDAGGVDYGGFMTEIQSKPGVVELTLGRGVRAINTGSPPPLATFTTQAGKLELRHEGAYWNGEVIENTPDAIRLLYHSRKKELDELKVKKLAWEADQWMDWVGFIESKDPVGMDKFVVEPEDENNTSYSLYRGKHCLGSFLSIKEAQAAAQENWENFIKSWVEE